MHAFDDVLDDHGIDKRLRNGASQGVPAKRKIKLSEMDAPLSLLDQLGIDVPHRDFSPEDAEAFPTSRTLEGGTTIHLFQDVRESDDTAFGDFGASEDSDDETVWTVTDLSGDEIVMKVVGEWSKRTVPVEDFEDEYEPITVETIRGEEPRLGY
jgi:hypothetical protein